MYSKREELLIGYNNARILGVMDSYILAVPNDLEAEFAAAISKIQDIN